MKNIHILPTNQPSRLFKDDFGRLIYSINIDQEQNHFEPQNIYITSDEEIKEGDYYIDYSIKTLVEIHKLKVKFGSKPIDCKKIILTTDTDLISDGVQAINDDFLEWFVHNPSYEWVEVKKGKMKLNDDGEEYGFPDMSLYKIIIPKEKIINCEHCVKIQGQELSPDCCHNYQYKIIIPKEEPKQEYEYIGECRCNNGNDVFKELAEWLLINKRSVFMDADISKESKKKIMNDLGYSSNSLDG